MSDHLPNIFPSIGPVTRIVLFTDFTPPGEPPTANNWREECDTLVEHGLAGVALRTIRQYSLGVPSVVLSELQRANFDAMASTIEVVRRSRQGMELLAAAKIPFVITKGPGIARESSTLSDRPFIDLDLVVHPSNFDQSREILDSLGYGENELATPPWACFNRFVKEAVNLRNHDGGSIDLHHHISPWNWSNGLMLADLIESAATVKMFDVSLKVVAPEHNLLIASLHVVSDRSQPGQTYRVWRDVLVLTSRCSLETVTTNAHAAGLSKWLAWILQCLPEEVRPLELLTNLLAANDELEHRWRLRRMLTCRPREVLGSAFRIPATNATLYLGGSLVPSRGYMRINYPSMTHPYLNRWRGLYDQFFGNPSPKLARDRS